MTKPAITFRNTKGSPLTYTELDENFNNLQDATLGFTVAGTNADIDLNSRLTVTAGSNITLTLVGSTLTIAATGGSGDTYAISAETATGGVNLRLTGGTGSTDNVKFANGSNISLIRTSADEITINGSNQFGAINVGGTNITPDQAQDTLTLSSSSGNLTLTPNASTDTIAFGFSTTPSFDRVLVQSGTGVTSAIDVNPASGVYGIEVRCPDSTPTAGIHFKGTSGTLLSMRFTDVEKTAASVRTLDGYIKVNVDGQTTHLPYYSNTTPSAGSYYIDDLSGTAATYTNGATVDFANFSGMIMVNRQDSSSGNVALWIVGSGTTLKLGDSNGDQSGTIAANGGINGYRWTNNTGGTITATFAAIRTRNGG